MSIGQNAVGADFGATSTSPTFGLGTLLWGQGGKAYVYAQANGAITGDGYAVVLDEAFQAALLTASNDSLGDKVGVVDVAFADEEYGWVQVYGPCGIRSEQDALANGRLAATAVGGQVDDAGSVGTAYVEGMVLGTATGGADAVNTTGSLNWPTVSTVGTYA